MLVNLTPHEVRIIVEGGPDVVLPPSGQIARVSTTSESCGFTPEGVPVSRLTFGETVGLPGCAGEEDYDVNYVVSTLVRQANYLRTDLFSPGELVRSPEGQPIGCRGLVRN